MNRITGTVLLHHGAGWVVVCAAAILTFPTTGWCTFTSATLPRYLVTDLGTLGGTRSFAGGINAKGDVVGLGQYGDAFLFHAFLYDGIMHDLGTLGGNDSGAGAINNAGLIVGSSTLPGKLETHAFLYDGTMHDLGTLGGAFGDASGINAAGHVVGWASNNVEDRHAFFYDGAMDDLGTLGGTESMATDINDAGLIVGWSKTAGDAATHAFLYDGSMHDLGSLGGSSSFAQAINDAGQVAGYSAAVGGPRAFLYDGAMHDLGTLGGRGSLGLAINSRGEVVGQSSLANFSTRAFLYTSATGMIDLNAFIDPLSGWVLTAARGINDAGQITGEGTIGGATHAYLLTPVPEPQGLALAVAALCSLVLGAGPRRGARHARVKTREG